MNGNEGHACDGYQTLTPLLRAERALNISMIRIHARKVPRWWGGVTPMLLYMEAMISNVQRSISELEGDKNTLSYEEYPFTSYEILVG